MMAAQDDMSIYKVALSMVRGITADLVRAIDSRGVPLKDFFEMDSRSLATAMGFNSGMSISMSDRDEAFIRAKKEMEFMHRHNIRAHFLLDEDYPVLLSELSDAPVALYQYGETDLNRDHVLNVVGTRRCTAMGLDWCTRFIKDLGGYFPDMTVVSGLAYGIDACAHQASLDNNICTMAVVAHGLDTIYPAAHRGLAYQIVQAGGSILSEYPSGVKSYRQHFLARNRLIAGLSELTVVVESEIKGGAMSTANYAFIYDREVMAVPGRVGDPMSAGCNHIIKREKAHLLETAADVVERMPWRPLDIAVTPRQRNLFPELEGDAKMVYELLKFQNEPMATDAIHFNTCIPMTKLLPLLSEMEFDGMVIRHPGNRYSLS